MTRAELRDHLVRMRACSESLEWFDATLGEPADLWIACPRVDWLTWFAERLSIDIRLIVLGACDCARLAGSDGDPYARRAIETAEAWTRGEATIYEVRAAASPAYGNNNAAAYAAASAYVAVAYAVSSITSNAGPAVPTVAEYDDAHRACADLVRARIPWSLVEAALEATR